MLIHICDKCGKEQDVTHPPGSSAMFTNWFEAAPPRELCPECSKDFDEFGQRVEEMLNAVRLEIARRWRARSGFEFASPVAISRVVAALQKPA